MQYLQNTYRLCPKRKQWTTMDIHYHVRTITVSLHNLIIWQLCSLCFADHFCSLQYQPISFFNFVCWFALLIVVDLIEFYATVMLVSGLVGYGTRFHISSIYYISKFLYQVSNITVVVHLFDLFERLILPFEWGISALYLFFFGVQYFCEFYFYSF